MFANTKLFCAVIFGAVIAMLVLGSRRIDGVLGLLGETFYVDQTNYAPGYSDYNFIRIRVGMSKGEVLKLIGEPIEWKTIPASETIGYWSQACCAGNYKNRVVMFREDVVYKVFSEYYWD